MLCRYVLLADPSTGGVDLGAKNEKGRTALALAALHGEVRLQGGLLAHSCSAGGAVASAAEPCFLA